MKIYGVATMDIVNSRGITDRDDFQQKLHNYINEVNQKYNKVLPVSINFTVGDEWQFITEAPEYCFDIIHEFQQLLWRHNISFYAGIGIGTLSTKLYESTGMMDGRCFLLAREAIDIAKGKNGSKIKNIHSKYNKIFFKSDLNAIQSNIFMNNFFNGDSQNDFVAELALSLNNETTLELLSFDRIINALIENTEILKNKMTYKQKETYINYYTYKSYRRMLKESSSLNTESTSGISQKLNTANYFTIQNNHALIKILINYVSKCLEK